MPFTPSPELLASGVKYRRELLAAPFVRLEPITKHMTLRYGVQGKEVVGTLSNQAQLRPYRTAKDAGGTTKIDMRELETFLGDVVEEFDPQALWSTLYANTVGNDPTAWDMAYKMAMTMASSVGENLALAVWKAKRNPAGNTTMDLFNGFETIIDNEKAAGKVSTEAGNLADVGVITQANVVDVLMEAYLTATHEVLRDRPTKMFLPSNLYSLYNKGYLTDFGSVPYNREYKKTFLEGSDNKCELVPMTGMSGERFIITTKRNMLVGMDQTGNKERVEIRRVDNPKVVQFFMLAYYGEEFESISERDLCVCEYQTQTPTPEPPVE